MKVFYVTMLFPAPAETFACNDVLALRKIGVDVSVHSLKFRDKKTADYVKQRKLEGVCLTHNSIKNTLQGVLLGIVKPSQALCLLKWITKDSVKKPVHFLKSFVLIPRTLQLLRQIEKVRPAVIHLFWGHYPSMLGCLVKERLPEIVLSISLGAYDLGMRYGGSGRALLQADLVTTFAGVNVEKLISGGAPPGKIKVIYRGIEKEKYNNWTVGINKENRKIVTVGRLIPGKKMSDVIKAFSEVNKRWGDSSLTVLGEGPLLGDLKKLARTLGVEDAVFFPGHVSHERVLKELKSADVFLFMSAYKNERLSNVVKEAMYCRAFCVVSGTPGITELIPDDRYGSVVSSGDIFSAVDAVNSFFERPEKYKHVIDNAHNYVVENFNVETEMRKLKACWERLLPDKKT